MADQTTEQVPDDGQQETGGEQKQYSPPATQADLDQIIEKRIARERAKYGDYEDLKKAKAELEKVRDSQLSEQEKAVKAAREEGVTEATTKFERRLVSAEVKIQASALGFHDASDALAAFGEELPLKDGDPDVDAIKAKLAEVAKAKPYLLKADVTIPRGKPRLPRGEKKTTQDGKGRAVAALRQLGQQRHR